MSIGNLKTDGNKGNNFPYQLKVLQGLQCVCDQLKELNVDTAAIEATLLDIEVILQTVETNTTGVQRTPGFKRTSGANFTIPAGAFSMSFASVGTGNAIVGTIILKPGETINFDAGALNNTLGPVAYNTTTNPGAELIVITLT
jgi:hypothetical protein